MLLRAEMTSVKNPARITVKLGTISKTFVLCKGPIPKLGDAVTFKGEGAEWTVSKVVRLNPEETFSVRFKNVRKPK